MQYKIVIMVALAWAIAELIKLIVEVIRNKEFHMCHVLAYGGMPSAHMTFVSSLSTTIYLVEGSTTAFLISIAFMLLVARDILALRTKIDRLGKACLKNDKPIAHSSFEMAVGMLLGIAIPLILNRFI